MSTSETLKVTIDVSAAQAAIGQLLAAEPLKVLADGTEIPASDPRTDHVAILYPDTGWMVARKALTTPKGQELKTADAVDTAATKLALLGFKDWINAPLDEVWLRHVLKHDRYSPAVDTNLYPDLPLGFYWTGTTTPWSRESAFVVGLHCGSVYYYHRHFSGFGLACRRARQ